MTEKALMARLVACRETGNVKEAYNTFLMLNSYNIVPGEVFIRAISSLLTKNKQYKLANDVKKQLRQWGRETDLNETTSESKRQPQRPQEAEEDEEEEEEEEVVRPMNKNFFKGKSAQFNSTGAVMHKKKTRSEEKETSTTRRPKKVAPNTNIKGKRMTSKVDKFAKVKERKSDHSRDSS